MMAENLCVCHLIGSLKYGGAERQVANLINNLNVRAKLLIVLSDQRDCSFYHLLENGIRLFCLPIKLRYCYYHIMNIAKILRKNRVEVLQTHMYWANLYGALAGRIAGVPVVVTTEHGKNPWKKEWHYWVERNIVTRLVDKRICVSKEILDIRSDKDGVPKGKLMYLPNAVNIPPSTRKQKSDKTVIGAAGRFIEAKDYFNLIEAAGRLRDKKVDFEMYILGDGPLRNELEATRRRLGLEFAVKMPGFQDNIDKWFRKFDVFVVCSIREGQPLVLLEAMAYGVAIVATSVGGIPDTLDDGVDGILVEPRNPRSLADAMETLIGNSSLRRGYGRKARERVKRDFSIKDICHRYEKTYLDLLEPKLK